MASIPPNIISDYFLAVYEWDEKKVVSSLNQYGALAHAATMHEVKFGDIGVVFCGNALHHTLIGPIKEIVPTIDGKVERIVAKLLELKCNVNEQEERTENTPLHYLCFYESDVGKEFAKLKFDIQDDDPYSNFDQLYAQITAANRASKLKIAEMLLQAGAKASLPNLFCKLSIDFIEDAEFKSKMDSLFKKYQPNYKEESASLVEEKARMIVLTKLVDENRADLIRECDGDPNTKNPDGVPLIIYALFHRKTDAFLALFEMNADTSVKIDQFDLFDLVVNKYNDQIFRKLLEAGFDPNRIGEEPQEFTLFNYLNQFSRVHWHKLALQGNLDAIEILVSRGIALDMDTKIEGVTILNLLKEDRLKNHPDLVEMKKALENGNKDTLVDYELVKLIDENPAWLKNGSQVIPEPVKEKFNGSPNYDEIVKKYLLFVANEISYNSISAKLKERFIAIEELQSLIAGVNDNHRQIIQLLEQPKTTENNNCLIL